MSLARLLISCPKLSSVILKSITSYGLRLIAAHCGPNLCVIEAAIYLGSEYDLVSFCRKCPTLTEFRLTAGRCQPSGVEVLEAIALSCPLIEVISLDHWKLTDAALDALASSHTLRVLKLVKSHQISSSAIQHVLQANPSMSEICLDGPFIDAALVSCIGRFCRNLTSLMLTNDAVLHEALQDLFRGCPLLTIVKLKLGGNMSTASLAALFQNCRQLVELDLSVAKLRFTDLISSFELLPPIESDAVLNIPYPSFRILVVHAYCVPYIIVREILTHCTNLKEVMLSSCNYITDENIRFLAKCPGMEKLELHGCKELTVTGLLELASKCTHLSELTLYSAPVSNDFLVQLSLACPYLSTLRLRSCTGLITGVGVIALAERCKLLREVNITFFGVEMCPSLDAIKKGRVYPHINFSICHKG